METQGLNMEFRTACVNNNLSKAKQLLEKGADIDHKNKYGDTLLNNVCRSRGFQNVISFLLENGADANTKDYAGFTPSMGLAMITDINSLEILVKHQPDFSAKDQEGWSVLDFAFMEMSKREIMNIELFEFFYKHRNKLTKEDQIWIEQQKMKVLLKSLRKR